MAAKKNKGNVFNWFLWWQIDPGNLQNQVKNYNKLNLMQSARGISFVLLIFSAIVTFAVSYFIPQLASGWIDAVLFLVLGFFIYRGYKLAMIAAMILWTIEKGGSIVLNPSNFVLPLIWWAIYMHAFYLAYKTEVARNK